MSGAALTRWSCVPLLAIIFYVIGHKELKDGLEIKSMAGLETFVQQVDGHNAFAHLLKYDELLQ